MIQIAYQRAHMKCPCCGGVRPSDRMLLALDHGPYPAIIWVQTIFKGQGNISWDVQDLDPEKYAGLLVMLLGHAKAIKDKYEAELRDLPPDVREAHRSPFEEGSTEAEMYDRMAKGMAAFDELDDALARGSSVTENYAARGPAYLAPDRGSASMDAEPVVRGAAEVEVA